MRVQVTAEDILEGVKCDGSSCPIARAIRRMMPDAAIGVTASFLEFAGKDGLFKKLALPEVASDFVDAFDEDKPVQPFEFDLDLRPDWTLDAPPPS